MKVLKRASVNGMENPKIFHRVDENGEKLCDQRGRMRETDTEKWPDSWWRWCQPCQEEYYELSREELRGYGLTDEQLSTIEAPA